MCVVLVHYTGKRPLALFSTLGVGICFVVAATYVYVQGEAGEGVQGEEGSSPYAWVPMVALVASALTSHAGIRVLPWLLIGEVGRHSAQQTNRVKVMVKVMVKVKSRLRPIILQLR